MSIVKPVKGDESEFFGIESGVRQGCGKCPLGSSMVYGWSDERSEKRNGADGNGISGRGERVEVV